MEFKKISADLEKQNYFRNIALKASKFCVKNFEGEDLEEDDEACLKKAAINLHNIIGGGPMEHYAIIGQPWKSY